MSVTDAKKTPPDFCPCCGSPRVATKGGEVRYDCNSTLKRRGVWCYRRAEGRWHVERQEMIEVLETLVRQVSCAHYLIVEACGATNASILEQCMERAKAVLAKVRGEA